MAISRLWPHRSGHTHSMTSQESLAEPVATALGDITVHKEVRVDVTRLNETSNALGSEAKTVVAAGEVPTTPLTYVDELYSLCYAPGLRLRPDSSLHQHNRVSL